MTALTRRERDVATLGALGHTNRQIARALCLEEKSVRCTLTNVYRKLPPHPGVHKRIVLVRWYERERSSEGDTA